MKTVLLREGLKSSLNIIDNLSAKAVGLPILNNILLSCGKSFLKISATDLDIALEYWILCKTEKEGQVTVPAKLFSGLIKTLSAEKIILEERDSNLHIQSEKEKIVLKTQKTEDFPIIPKIKTKKEFDVDMNLFCDGLAQVVDSVSVSQNRPELCGVFFRVAKNIITMAATDTFRLSEKTINISRNNNETEGKEYTFIVPSKVLYKVVSFFSNQKGQLKILLDDNQIGFECYSDETGSLQVRILSKLIEGDFPNYPEIIPQKFDSEAILKKTEFTAKIKAASVLSNKINEVSIFFDVKNQNIEIKTQNPDSGECQSFVSGEIKGDAVVLDFNWRFLLSGLINIKSQEIILTAQKNGGPSTVRPVGDDSYICVIMPIRVS